MARWRRRAPPSRWRAVLRDIGILVAASLALVLAVVVLAAIASP